jgi:hypothetical protein
MKRALRNIIAFFQFIPTTKRRAQKAKGQSLVEIAIAFPVIIMLLSGLVEFGFMLNYYLSLMDATREAARTFNNFDPFEDGTLLGDCTCSVALCPNEAEEDRNDGDCDRLSFYQGAAGMVLDNLQPKSAQDTSRRIVLNSASDDVVISVFSVGPDYILRYPDANSGEYRWFNNQPSRFSIDDIGDRLVEGAPDTGILLVEVFFDYHQVLALPWLAPFMPNPTMLHAYTVMPLPAAEPQ